MSGKVLQLFPDRASGGEEGEGDVPHHDIGYTRPEQARPRPVAVADGPLCAECHEPPVGGVLHGRGTDPRRRWCGLCVGKFNRARVRR